MKPAWASAGLIMKIFTKYPTKINSCQNNYYAPTLLLIVLIENDNYPLESAHISGRNFQKYLSNHLWAEVRPLMVDKITQFE